MFWTERYFLIHIYVIPYIQNLFTKIMGIQLNILSGPAPDSTTGYALAVAARFAGVEPWRVLNAEGGIRVGMAPLARGNTTRTPEGAPGRSFLQVSTRRFKSKREKGVRAEPLAQPQQSIRCKVLTPGVLLQGCSRSRALHPSVFVPRTGRSPA